MPTMMAPAIELEDVRFSYDGKHDPDRLVLDGLSGHLRAGGFHVILGASGCGKSTLLRLLAGMMRPSGGRILVGGEAPLEPSLQRSLLFQDSFLFPWMTVRKNVEFVLKQVQPQRQTFGIREEAAHLLRMVDLEDAFEKYPHELSGGMRKRAAFAATLAQGASLWLLDEPFSALDPPTRDRNMALLHTIIDQGKAGITLVLVTHDLDDAAMPGHTVHFLYKGRFRHHVDLTGADQETCLGWRATFERWFQSETSCG